MRGERSGMERRIAAIVRWLERCLKEYRAGSLEGALMEAECARADIEHLRRDVWARMEQRQATLSRRGNLRGLRRRLPGVLGSVLLLLLLTASPLSAPSPSNDFSELGEPLPPLDLQPWSASLREVEVEAERFSRVDFSESAPTTPHELTPELALKPGAGSERKRQNVRAVAQAESGRRTAVSALSGAKAMKKSVTTAQPLSPQPEPEKTVPYDHIFSLLQTGSRALKNEEPAIKIKIEK
ncbi:MAG: hypothetical protein GX256_10025 [Fretibacterium sp.]|nr:hypothetical protein [Fretibacterium sp.]